MIQFKICRIRRKKDSLCLNVHDVKNQSFETMFSDL